MKIIKIFMLFLISSKIAIAQKRIEPCRGTTTVNIDSSSRVNDEHLLKDTSKRELRIVFEQEFNDKISILLNDDLFLSGIFKTEKNLGVCLKTISIDYSKFKKVPKVSIVLSSKNNCIAFYPIVGKRIAYINCIGGAWSVEVSNIQRDYR